MFVNVIRRAIFRKRIFKHWKWTEFRFVLFRVFYGVYQFRKFSFCVFFLYFFNGAERADVHPDMKVDHGDIQRHLRFYFAGFMRHFQIGPTAR